MIRLLAMLAAALLPLLAAAQSYPAKPVKIIAVFPPGGKPGETLNVRWIGDAAGEFSQQITLPSDGKAEAAIVARDVHSEAPSPNVLRVSDLPWWAVALLIATFFGTGLLLIFLGAAYAVDYNAAMRRRLQRVTQAITIANAVRSRRR